LLRTSTPWKMQFKTGLTSSVIGKNKSGRFQKLGICGRANLMAIMLSLPANFDLKWGEKGKKEDMII
jgi:hypothetical protein